MMLEVIVKAKANPPLISFCHQSWRKRSDNIDYRLAEVVKLLKWKKKNLEEDGVEFKNEVDKYSLDDREIFFDDSFDLLN